MKPQDIFDYKLKWRSNNPIEVPFHSDYMMNYYDWCKENFNKWQYDIITWTGVYEHTMIFESAKDAEKFKLYIEK